MRRITLWILSTLSALVLLFSYHTSTESTAAAPATISVALPPATTSTTEPAPTESSADTTSSGASPSDPPTTTSQNQTFTGAAVETRFGPVQVQITVVDNAITEATATEVPDSNGKDQQINTRAVPILENETTQAQSSEIDMVSGATYTSEGYIQSLQSAIDQANLS